MRRLICASRLSFHRRIRLSFSLTLRDRLHAYLEYFHNFWIYVCRCCCCGCCFLSHHLWMLWYDSEACYSVCRYTIRTCVCFHVCLFCMYSMSQYFLKSNEAISRCSFNLYSARSNSISEHCSIFCLLSPLRSCCAPFILYKYMTSNIWSHLNYYGNH